MHHTTPLSRVEVENHLRSLRCRARLSQRQLADLSRVSRHLIRTLEDRRANSLIIDQILAPISGPAGMINIDRVMRQTLVTWAEQFHRLATALDAPFESVFPPKYLTALSDQL